MAERITWQALTNQNLPDPAKFMAMGIDSINAGMTGFQKAADSYWQGQPAGAGKITNVAGSSGGGGRNMKVTGPGSEDAASKTENLSALKQSLFGKSVEELEAYKASGAFDERLDNPELLIDRLAANTAFEDRLAAVQKQSLVKQEYASRQAGFAEAMPVASLSNALLNTTTEEEVNNINLGTQSAMDNGVLSPATATALLQKGIDRIRDLAVQKQNDSATVRQQQADAATLNERTTISNVARLHGATIRAQQERSAGIAQDAVKAGMSIDPETGIIAPSAERGQTPEFVAKFKKEMDAKWGPPVSTSQASDEARTFLSQSGLPLNKINQLTVDLDRSLSDGSNASSSDAKKLLAFKEDQKLKRAAFIKNNPFADPNADRDSEKIRILKLTDGIKDWRASGTVPRAFNDLMENGYMHNGVKRDVPPRVLEKMIAAVGGVQKDTIGWNSTITEVEAQLQNYFDNPDTLKAVEESKLFDTRQNQERAKLVSQLKIVPPANSHDKALTDYLDTAVMNRTAATEAANKPKK